MGQREKQESELKRKPGEKQRRCLPAACGDGVLAQEARFWGPETHLQEHCGSPSSVKLRFPLLPALQALSCLTCSSHPGRELSHI